MDFVIQETEWAGKTGYHYELLDSTNKKAKELAEAGCPHGTLVTADGQEAGVGRRGRSWSSEKGQGIYMSLVLKPKLEANRASMLTLVAAMAVAKAIGELTKNSGVLPFIKWPNDIVIRGKKVCGILTEMTMKENKVGYIVVGIGVNVYNTDFPEEIAHRASSLKLELGDGVPRERLIVQILLEFEKYYGLFLQEGDLKLLMEEYQQMSANIGQSVTVLDPGGAYEGVAKGITKDGELMVDTPEGTRLVSSGEVSVRGIYGYV